jgi:hypothetical protein
MIHGLVGIPGDGDIEPRLFQGFFANETYHRFIIYK